MSSQFLRQYVLTVQGEPETPAQASGDQLLEGNYIQASIAGPLMLAAASFHQTRLKNRRVTVQVRQLEENQPPMRDHFEIQRAHDMLCAIVLRETPLQLDSEHKPLVIANLDALCWVLQHEHNQTLAQNLLVLRGALEQLGVTEIRRAHAGS